MCAVGGNTWLSQWSGRDDANEPDVRDLYLGVYAAFGIGQGNSKWNLT